MKIGVPKAYPETGQVLNAVKLACRLMHVNCTYSWDYNEFGHVLDDGTVTGIVGAVSRGQYDTSIPLFTPTYSRSKVISFSQIYTLTPTIAVTRAPANISHQLNWSIALSFHIHVWIAFAISVLIVTLITVISIPIFPRNWSFFMRVCVSVITNDFQVSLLRALPVRMVLGAWFLSAVIINSAYSAILFEKAMRLDPIVPFRDYATLVQCLDNDKCQLITDAISATAFQSMPTEHKAKAILSIDFDTVFTTMFADTRKYLVLVTSDVFAFISENEDCKYYKIDLGLADFNGFPMAKNSTYANRLDLISLMFREFGMDLLLNKRDMRPTKCLNEDWRPASSLHTSQTLHSMIITFCFYGFGVIVALIAFGMEILVKKSMLT